MRPIYSPDVDLIQPTRLRDLVPARASLLRAIERYQRALLTGWGGAACGQPLHIDGDDHVNTTVRVPPGVIRLGFKALLIGGRARFAVDEGAGLYQDLASTAQVIPYAPALLRSAAWVTGSLDAPTEQLTGYLGAAIPLAPVFVWRQIALTVYSTSGYIFAATPLFAFVDEDRGEVGIEWTDDASALRGGTGNPGMAVNGWSGRWSLSEWRTVIIWLILDDVPTGHSDTLLEYTHHSGDASMRISLEEGVLTLTTLDDTGTLQRSIEMTTAVPSVDGFHQVILSWQENATGAEAYLDGAADTLATDTVTSPDDLGTVLDRAVVCAHEFGDLAVAEVAMLWGRLTADEVAEVSASRRDLSLTSVGRRVMECWASCARDEDPDTSSNRYANLGAEPSWQTVVEPDEASLDNW